MVIHNYLLCFFLKLYWVINTVCMQEVKVPRCRICDGVMKMDVVLFGEPLESSIMDCAMDAAIAADVILVVGTSLTVGSVVHPSFSSSSFFCLKTCIMVDFVNLLRGKLSFLEVLSKLFETVLSFYCAKIQGDVVKDNWRVEINLYHIPVILKCVDRMAINMQDNIEWKLCIHTTILAWGISQGSSLAFLFCLLADNCTYHMKLSVYIPRHWCRSQVQNLMSWQFAEIRLKSLAHCNFGGGNCIANLYCGVIVYNSIPIKYTQAFNY